jgi:serine/threonine-protein kinase
VQSIAPDTVIDGRYRVIGRVGSGGMADVYCARDLQLGRKVALKLLYRRFAEDQEFVERFRREASSAAGLQHPSVVGVFDRGEWDGTYYIAMEFLEGRSLKQLVAEEGPLDPDRAVDLTIQLLRAARFAHRRGIIHRDFKPHNVIVDAEDRAKVTDFGIARAGASDMTETGSIMGTAQYLSPEQAQGHAVSARSDLYSIGIVLYELLTGRVPFAGESPVTVALKQVSEEPVPPRALNPAVSPELERVVLHALQKDPAMRFADADAFIRALEQAAGGDHGAPPRTGGQAFVVPDGPVGATALAPATGPDRRRLGLVALALLVAAGLAVGAYLLLAPEQVTVPNVVGNRADTAAARLQNAGFGVDIERARSDTAPAERVFRQSPGPSEKADEGATVTILVSDGPADGTVPTVEGLAEREARRRVERAGFRVRVRRRTSASVAAGRVVSSSPEGRARLQKGRTVTLSVSSGPEQVSVPDVTGEAVDEARSELEAAGFQVTVQEREDAEAEAGTVLAQEPGAGATADAGASVALTVARAPRLVAVPDVSDRPTAEATAALREAGFRPRIRRETTDAIEEDGRVIDQSPPADAERRRGATVFITVGRFEPPAPDPTPTPSPSPTP